MNFKKYIALSRGIATYIPGLHAHMTQIFGTIFGRSARYCYSRWLRHLTMAHKNGFPNKPNVIAELGPGDSLGVGFAALLSGSNKFYAFDVVKYNNPKKNLKIFDELVDLFKRRENIPNEIRFPEVEPYIKSYEFPGHILTETRLNEALRPERIESIRNAIINLNNAEENEIQIFYFAPWYNSAIIKEESVDMIFSNAVLEHVDDLKYTYELLHRWLKPGGFMSHQINFECHEIAKEWNGHWTYSDFVWRLIRGKRSFLLNRDPHSTHIELMKKIGFKIVCDIKVKKVSKIQRKKMAPRFRNLSEEDLTTSRAFIQAIKKNNWAE
nr:methyltransferase domain-containing protein [Candidatus Freyarchaeota archaeon]